MRKKSTRKAKSKDFKDWILVGIIILVLLFAFGLTFGNIFNSFQSLLGIGSNSNLRGELRQSASSSSPSSSSSTSSSSSGSEDYCCAIHGVQCGPHNICGNCGGCPRGYSCSGGQCICIPNCVGKNCGPDGCGSNCGECSTGPCNEATGRCEMPCGKEGLFYDPERQSCCVDVYGRGLYKNGKLKDGSDMPCCGTRTSIPWDPDSESCCIGYGHEGNDQGFVSKGKDLECCGGYYPDGFDPNLETCCVGESDSYNPGGRGMTKVGTGLKCCKAHGTSEPFNPNTQTCCTGRVLFQLTPADPGIVVDDYEIGEGAGLSCCNVHPFDPTTQICCKHGSVSYYCYVTSEKVCQDGYSPNKGSSANPGWNPNPGFPSDIANEEPSISIVAYSFDGNANDIIGTNEGTVYGAVLSTGIFGQDYIFDGVNDYIATSIKDPYDTLSSGSVTAWFKCPANCPAGAILAYSSKSTDSSNMVFRVRNNVLEQAWNPTGSTSWGLITAKTPINDSKWHYVAFVHSSGFKTKIYLDGVEQATTFSRTSSYGTETDWIININGISTYTHEMTIGVLGRMNPTNWFKGDIDEVKIYDKALTLAEIQNLSAAK